MSPLNQLKKLKRIQEEQDTIVNKLKTIIPVEMRREIKSLKTKMRTLGQEKVQLIRELP